MLPEILRIRLSAFQTGKAKDVDITVSYCCCLCGKKLIEGNDYDNVHLFTDGNIVSTGDGENRESQGFFPVGNECKKRLPKHFVFCV